MTNAVPERLDLDGDTLHITWTDGRRLRYSVRGLRGLCPCAGCHEERIRRGTDDAPLPVGDDVRLAGMEPVGNYAYRLRFSDGHQTGIYRLEFLREIGQPE
ncbi:DUF971 domain-containing protein [Thermostilla marina]